MPRFELTTPVALFLFNRPHTTERVLSAIAQARPPKLLVVADGPRPDHPGEAETCAAARALIERIDWDCEVLTQFSDINLGMKRRQSSGFDWIFETVEEAILLEDDTLPHPSFFRFCQELLERYRDDERIGLISGNNFQFGRRRSPHSYYFSHYHHTWGWASWRRSWQHFDLEMRAWPEFRDGVWLRDVLRDERAVRHWTHILEATYRGEISTWDFQWQFACWMHGTLAILPSDNLVTNIGFGQGATFTKDLTSPFSNIPSKEMDFPLSHPPFMVRDTMADRHTDRTVFTIPPLPVRAFNKLGRSLRYHLGAQRPRLATEGTP